MPRNGEVLVTATTDEHASLVQVDRLLEREVTGSVRLVDEGGRTVELPESAVRALREAVHTLANGHGVMLVPAERELTTQQAADILNVSRPYLVQLLEQGTIPHVKVGTHRRVRLADVLAYKQERDSARREQLRVLTQLSQEWGLYETGSTG